MKYGIRKESWGYRTTGDDSCAFSFNFTTATEAANYISSIAEDGDKVEMTVEVLNTIQAEANGK